MNKSIPPNPSNGAHREEQKKRKKTITFIYSYSILIYMDYKLPILECKRCGHKWTPRKEERPVTRPNCKSPYWDKKRGRGRDAING